MSVYTHLTVADFQQLLSRYHLGQYVSHKGISAGVENTNYFVETDQHSLVLTLFESLAVETLPFFLELTEHLNQSGCQAPLPYRDLNGQLLQTVKGKPAVFIERLTGHHPHPTEVDVTAVATVLAKVHNATEGYPAERPHSHDRQWVRANAQALLESLPSQDQALLQEALGTIDSIPETLPQGVIHADLFHDNVLFDGDAISGVLDWYFAGVDSYALDIAITLNDWTLTKAGRPNDHESERFIEAYHAVRPLSQAELGSMPALRVQSATRFWLSRLLAQREHGESDEHVTVKDPDLMKMLLQDLLRYTVES